MGHFSMTCGLSGLPITGSTPAILILMKGSSMLQYAKGSEYGETNLISNEGPRLIYVPFAYPIKGRYDDYGGIEVEEDDNTKVLEDYFGLPIQDLMNIVTSNRKSDGFDTALKKIKKGIAIFVLVLDLLFFLKTGKKDKIITHTIRKKPEILDLEDWKNPGMKKTIS